MSDFLQAACTAFEGDRVIAAGGLAEVVAKVHGMTSGRELPPILIFNDSTSEQIEVDFRGTPDEVLERLGKHPDARSVSASEHDAPRAVGRPKLGVVAGEVTLLPRHWQWLKSQPGGASVTLRKLVDEARRVHAKGDAARSAQEKTYRFMVVMAGDRSHYEEALRALYAADSVRFYELIDGWPTDIRDYIKRLSADAFPETPPGSKS